MLSPAEDLRDRYHYKTSIFLVDVENKSTGEIQSMFRLECCPVPHSYTAEDRIKRSATTYKTLGEAHDGLQKLLERKKAAVESRKSLSESKHGEDDEEYFC